MSDVLHAKSVEMDLGYYESAQYYDTLHRAQREAPYRPTHVVNGVVQIGQNGISLLAMAGLLFLFHWMVAVVLFVAVLPGIAVRLAYAGRACWAGWRGSTKTTCSCPACMSFST